MNIPSPGKSRALIFFCMRRNPDKFPGLRESIVGDLETRKIEVPCSGRVGIGELMQALAAGYEIVVVLSCGEKSCIHEFGCLDSKKAMERAKRLAEVAGVDTGRLVFIEAESPGNVG